MGSKSKCDWVSEPPRRLWYSITLGLWPRCLRTSIKVPLISRPPTNQHAQCFLISRLHVPLFSKVLDVGMKRSVCLHEHGAGDDIEVLATNFSVKSLEDGALPNTVLPRKIFGKRRRGHLAEELLRRTASKYQRDVLPTRGCCVPPNRLFALWWPGQLRLRSSRLFLGGVCWCSAAVFGSCPCYHQLWLPTTIRLWHFAVSLWPAVAHDH